MNSNVKNITLAVSLAIIFITLASCATPNEEAKKNEHSNKHNLAGGWYAGSINEEVKQAALFARKQLKKEQYSIQSIKHIQQQVVAGINYQFNMVLSDNSEYQLKVYQNLNKQYQLLERKQVNK